MKTPRAVPRAPSWLRRCQKEYVRSQRLAAPGSDRLKSSKGLMSTGIYFASFSNSDTLPVTNVAPIRMAFAA